MDRMDGLIKRKTSVTEDLLVQSVSEMQKTNARLVEEMKALRAQVLTKGGISHHVQNLVSDTEDEEERKWVPPDEEQKEEIAQGWDKKSDEIFQRIMGLAGTSNMPQRELPSEAVSEQVSSSITRLHCMNPDIDHERLFKMAVEETATSWETGVANVLEAIDRVQKQGQGTMTGTVDKGSGGSHPPSYYNQRPNPSNQ